MRLPRLSICMRIQLPTNGVASVTVLREFPAAGRRRSG